MISGSDSYNTAYGGDGRDLFDATAYDGDYYIDLGTGMTGFLGEVVAGFEDLEMGDGNDRLTGTGGANRIEGGAGNDTIAGGGGADSTYGGLGDDLILAHGADAILDGGDGIDTLDCTGVTGDFWLDLNTGETAALGQSATGFENLRMGAGHDTLVGSSAANLLISGDGNDRLYAGLGRDTLYGGNGQDALYGEDGSDRLVGGQDQDRLFGGGGVDLFVFRPQDYSVGIGVDILRGRNGGAAFDGAGLPGGDRIDLHLLDADRALDGDQAFALGGRARSRGQHERGFGGPRQHRFRSAFRIRAHRRRWRRACVKLRGGRLRAVAAEGWRRCGGRVRCGCGWTSVSEQL